MDSSRALSLLTLSATIAGVTLAAAGPASAGGIGDILSPAFGTNCSNLKNGTHASGATTAGTGTADGNLLGLPFGSPLNQCGGADLTPNEFYNLSHDLNKAGYVSPYVT
ncbi:hypothetical protein ABZ366_02800 [Streptomyces sp. NPDC005904]|uniref:hypothetical protein n=1 Tax=Streptomyces sp. NPDC005904 TaxID=3154570 RepID=UPI00340C5C6C